MAESSGGDGQGNIPNQLASLVPSFDPSKDDLQMYQQKEQMVLTVWPPNRISELVTRLILNTSGSAFAKLQLHHTELSTNETKSVHKLIEHLGGHWGQTGLERRFSDAEKALYQCNQQTDESHDSYLARADVLWSKLASQKLQMEDLQAYITLRGASLTSDDKKRIILDSDQSLDGKLTISRVREAVRMLGTSFFQEMTGQGRKTVKTKVYDSNVLLTEDQETSGDMDDQVHQVQHEDFDEDEMIETLLAEGDNDAAFVADYEAAASELLQSDDELSTAYTSYVEARRKLSEKFRARGFFPIGKGKSKFGKGKSKGRSNWGRKSLQQRILESHCRLCGRKGHWKGECPSRSSSNSGTSQSAAVTLSVASSTTGSDQVMAAEFMDLPLVSEENQQDTVIAASNVVQTVFSVECLSKSSQPACQSKNMRDIRERIRNYVKGNNNTNSGVKSLVHRIEAKLRSQTKHPSPCNSKRMTHEHILCPSDPTERHFASKPTVNPLRDASSRQFSPVRSPIPAIANSAVDVLFATHDSWGIIDTGATKTVMGNNHVASFLNAMDPEVRKHVQRCSCDVVFRFGNQGTLKASHAMVVPVAGMKLKIAVVEGSTPFLISNTLLRALGAMIDTERDMLIMPKHDSEIPLKLSSKGLYLIDMNLLFQIASVPKSSPEPAETYAQDTQEPAKTAAESLTDSSPFVKVSPEINTTPGSKAQGVSTEIAVSKTQQHNDSNLWPQSNRAETPPDCSVDSHEQLESAPFQSPGPDSSSGPGDTRWSQADRHQGHPSDVWESPFGQNPRGSMAIRPRVGEMVHESLPEEHPNGTPSHDQVHSAEGGGERSRGSHQPSGLCQAKGASQIPGCQSQEHAQPKQSLAVASGTRNRSLRDDDRGSDAAVHRQHGVVRECPRPPGENAELGKCHATHDRVDVPKCQQPDADQPCHANSRDCTSGVRRSLESVDGENDDWSLQAGEIDEFCESIPNHERVKFWDLVNKIERELIYMKGITTPSQRSIDVIEVFCGPQSTLTEQVQKLGGIAFRFGLSQGDLQSTEGRRRLFALVLKHQPRNIWMSPTCGPWGKWSQFNSQRSLVAWDKINQQREDMLSQIALCLVLCRHQHRCQRQAHLEQTKGSLMIRLPYLQELHRYMLSAKPDLCRAGELRDPQNHALMRKGLHIMTSSQRMFDCLNHLKCSQDHDHQVVEGSTVWQGKPMLRSEFTENYPRKFSRLVAKMLIKTKFPQEKPLGMIADPALILFDQLHNEILATGAQERPSKRVRVNPTRGLKTPAAAGASDRPGTSKRPKVVTEEQTNKSINFQDFVPASEQIQKMMNKIESFLPRVGRKVLDQPDILKNAKEIFSDMDIKKILACKGTDRRLGPPLNMLPEEAPFRRSILKVRDTQEIMVERSWEKYDQISKRQLNRSSPPCRVNITMFAANPESIPIRAPCTENPEGIHQPAKSSDQGMPEVAIKQTLKEPQNTSTETKPEISETIEPIDDAENTDKDATLRSPPHETSDMESHGPRFRALPREEQAMLKRAHKNLCHPSPEQLSQVLRSQGCRSEVSQAVYDMKCSTCASQQRPKISRPSALKTELDFNDKVFIDGVTWTSKGGQSFHFYHILDQATNYHVAVPAPSRAAEQAVQKISDAWFQWAGPPNSMIMDSATEFTSEKFEEFLQRHDVKSTITCPHAHWQNGRSERHGQILQTMLTKIDTESPITSFHDMQQALIQCTHAKNTLSIRRGFSPEVLVFGKSSKIPGSNVSSDEVSAHESALREDAHGIMFRRNLALREKARTAYHQADNDMALRRACLRRSRPDRTAYEPGEGIMMWQPQKNLPGYWFGPLKVIQQEDRFSIWASMGGKLHRRAPEHVRPVCASEAHRLPEEIPMTASGKPNFTPTITIPHDEPVTNMGINNYNPEESVHDTDNNSQSQDQPDGEPDDSPFEMPNSQEQADPPSVPETHDPEPEGADDLITTHLLCADDVAMTVDPTETPCAWRFELDAPRNVTTQQLSHWHADEILIASTEKKQRTEVKLSSLNPEELNAFKKAKENEVQNWLSTGTVSKILRSKLAPEQILRCRWILVWKPLEEKTNSKETNQFKSEKLKTHKPKARLVVLGYLDPDITEVPRDSPTLGRQSKMLLLQLIASKGWSLGSFDIRAAFLQGKPQQDRIIGIEPVPELSKAMSLKENEVCKLDKSAYGLIDAPFLWYKTLCEELRELGFQASPFDPCLYVLRHPETKELSGALGIHVDDGIHGGDAYFHSQISKLETKYPFGSKKSKSFTFTGIEMYQHPDKSIELSQTKYVNHISPIAIRPERKSQENEPVTEEERHNLRGLVGSLQYAAVHTRPDIASALSHLQSQINSAKIATLITANKVLHNAKKHSDVSIKIQPINTQDLRFIAFSDASFASKSKPDSHAGMIILSTHQDITRNQSCPISPLSWGTKKIQRIVTSTLSAETSALSSTLDQLTWMRLYWAWILNPNTAWQKPEEAKNLPPAITLPTYKVNDQDLAITDCKSLYDLTTRTAIPNCQEFRTQLLARSIKDIMSEGIRLHWVHSGAQLADALTKVMEANFLRETLRNGRYCLHDSEEVLKNRASNRNRLKWLRTATDQKCL